MPHAISNFAFLQSEWPSVYEAACKAEAMAYSDPRAACFYARRGLEAAVGWLYKHDAALRLPYQDNLSALIHEPTFRKTAGEAVFNKARVIQRQGNDAVHSTRPVRQFDALTVVRELFHFSYWLAHTYARGAKPAPGVNFDPEALSQPAPLPKQTIEQLQQLENQLRERDEKLSALLAGKSTLDAELIRLRGEIAETKKANSSQADTHDYSEAETRDFFIDLLLKEAGWPLDQNRDREYEVTGMPNAENKGFVDYVLWGDDGKPLGLVEAKRTKKTAQIGQQQAKLYADCLEQQFGRRPVIFYTNGYEHWLWDDASYAPRQVQGFYKKVELELMIQRRGIRKKLSDAEINAAIVERYYQTRAIRRINEAFERDLDRKALVVMATGAGKTRTVIALCDLLMRCNWVKRVLFLADRVALVNQAVTAFKKFQPDASPVNLVTEKDTEGRVFVSTYPTMMRLIDEARDGQRRFGVGHFDLVIVDEAQRFDINYPHHKGDFARVIHCDLPYAESLIDAFSHPAKAPHIAISVDMLDTGIDVPEVLNLVFFKLVRSKTKFWQMIGRGTRLCPEVFGPGRDKEFFYVFDYCQNLEFFSQDPATTDGSLGASLGKRLFTTRLELIATLDKDAAEAGEELAIREDAEILESLRHETAALLREEVAAMNMDNFIVRPQRRLVEQYAVEESWKTLSPEALGELAHHVAGLPSEMETDDEEAKRFDLLMLNLQLALLRSEPGFTRLRDQVKAIAGLLEEKGSIPMVQKQLPLILEIQTDEWWEHVTLIMLDRVRKHLRLLVKLIEKQKRKPIYTNFEDQMGDETPFDLPGFAAPDTYERFRAKARHFLEAHKDHLTIHKLRTNERLTATDLAELERMFIESGIGTAEDLEKAKTESNGIGLFVRSLVGMDRKAAKNALGVFLSGGSLTANQIQFLDEVVNHLTEHGFLDAGRLYESPYTDLNDQGVDGIFNSQEVDKLISILADVRKRASVQSG